MTADVPLWAGIPAVVLLVLAGVFSLTGSVGLLRLRDFYSRVHAPTLATTMGAVCTLLASVLVFSALRSRLALHELVIALLLVLTSPVTAMLLMRAARYRMRRREQQAAGSGDSAET